MKIACYVLGGQSYSKDGKQRTYLDLVTIREGKGVSGFSSLGGVVLDGDRLSDFKIMSEEYQAECTLDRFGDNQRIRIHSIS